jgi:tryptophan synthase alpha chain
MARIDDIFSTLRPVGFKALMPFVCGGFPRPGLLGQLLEACESGGAVIAEVGIPFSDPIADGPVIAAAMHEAIVAGATPLSVMQEVQSARGKLGLGIVAMVSVSIVHRMGGPAGFAKIAMEHGFDGLIVPDAPLEEAGAIRDACRANDMAFSMLIAPSTPRERAEAIAKSCTGFVYVMARMGITGESSQVPEVANRVQQLRQVTDLPLAVGFGVSNADHVAAVVKHADAAIVGSALVKRLGEAHKAKRDVVRECKDIVASLAIGLTREQPQNDPNRRLA